MKHRLAEMEEEFLEDGVKAVCACGFKTPRCRDDQEAMKAIKAHIRLVAALDEEE